METQKLLQHDTEPNSSSFLKTQSSESSLKVLSCWLMCDKQQTAGWRANLHIISSLHQPLDRIVVLFPPKPHEMIQATYSSRRTRNTCDFTCKHTETLQQNKHVRKSLICVIYPLLLTDLRATYGLNSDHKISKQAVPVVLHRTGKNLKSTIINNWRPARARSSRLAGVWAVWRRG